MTMAIEIPRDDSNLTVRVGETDTPATLDEWIVARLTEGDGVVVASKDGATRLGTVISSYWYDGVVLRYLDLSVCIDNPERRGAFLDSYGGDRVWPAKGLVYAAEKIIGSDPAADGRDV